MKAFNTSFVVTTEERTEVTDITKLVRDQLQQIPVTDGMALINTMHTTCALFVNEFQGALIDDLKILMERLVPERGGYRHDDPRYSDCERGNAQAHLRVALLGRSIATGVSGGDLVLGRFQSIILAEFDGPRKREIHVQVIGGETPPLPPTAPHRSCVAAGSQKRLRRRSRRSNGVPLGRRRSCRGRGVPQFVTDLSPLAVSCLRCP